MTVEELIERLQDYDSNAEVRLMTQSEWPFENDIFGVCDTNEINDCLHPEDEDSDPEGENIVYITEGAQLCYGRKAAWEASS